ncbi:isochorismatase hydrolase family [Micractinium conductrix]|uniref:Isochorismatase hydrolase family n=1 Tax=Micractinium conductrix TaxID=554055 RepID=A0A2P6V1M4_9CHLO|nr:isochorismatase hydrolase family [Micractinium conductrix]|eukprot:PSC67988.1 isochorismatase hydrolase family [Micractinium conductrix]
MASPREALLVVDMQNDFCLPDSVLCVKDAVGCLPKVVEAVEAARASGVDVVWVIRHHDPAGVDVEVFRAPMFAQGKGSTIPGTPGAELVAPLATAPGERVVVKKRFSGFFQTELDMVLRRRGVQRVTICGVQTPNCIRGTAWDAIALDYPCITVLADATASANAAVQEANLADMRAVAIYTPTVVEWAAQLAGGGGGEA